MSARIGYQTILENGQPKYAVVPIETSRTLLNRAGAAEATIPHEVVSAVVDGASPARAWREHLKLSQVEVAKRKRVSQPAYAQMESKRVRQRKATRERIAKGFGLIPEQLDF